MPPPIIPKIQESDDTCYPPAKFAKDGTSPYFMGKHKAARKRVEKGNVLTKFGFGCEGIISRTQQDRKKQAVSSHSSMIQVPSVLSGTSTNGSNGLSFDFSDDPKLRRVREVIVSIVDSDRKRENDKELHEAVAAASCKSMEQLCGSKSKKSKWRDKQVIASINDFKTASGDEVIKEMKQVLCEHGNTESSSNLLGNSLCSENIDKSRRFLGNRKIPQMFVAPPVKKTLHTMDVKEENGADVSERGLRTESSLKHFEENIISLIESEIMSVTHEIGWSDVAGLEGAKKALREIVVLPFKRPDMFKGIRAPPKGVLLFGPPGTGKTMIGRCVASQCNATFFNISASSLTSKWVGEGEKLVRALFSVARLKLPSVIFIDEVDSLLSSRSEVEHESSRRIKTEFLVQLDGVATNSDERLLVLAATNRPQELDEAARRRFVKRLYIALPDEEARCTIVKNLLADMKHSLDEKQFNQVAKLTEGYSGADVRQLCAEAAMGPIRDIDNCSSLDIETIETEDIRHISIDDFVSAAQVVRPTVVSEDLQVYKSWDARFGCLT